MRMKVAAVIITFSFAAFLNLSKQHQVEREEDEHIHYGNFKAFSNYILNTTRVLASFEVQDFFDCAFKCIAKAACFSLNIAILPSANFYSYACHLLASDKYNDSSQFLQSQEFHHFAIVSSCESSPCKNGGKCVSLYMENSFVCDCLEGFYGNYCEQGDNWRKVGEKSVCFGARINTHGTFNITQSGLIYRFKLVYHSGAVSCDPFLPSTFWGCTAYGNTPLATVITFPNGTALPLAEYKEFAYSCGGYSYGIDDVGVNASELIFNILPSPMPVFAGYEFQIRYGEAFTGCGWEDNSRTTCADVYAWYT